MRCSASKATGLVASASCGPPRTASDPPRRSACSRWARPAFARSRTPPAPSSWSTTPPHRGASSVRRSRGRARCWSWGRPSTPRRTAIGLDPSRLALLVAVLARRAGIGLGSHDVYANLAGGLAADDPGLDLAVAIALASTFRDRPVAAGTVAIAEIGLLGELRPVAGLERRLREAARLGFTWALVPPGRGDPPAIPGIAVVTVRTVREALDVALGPAGG